MIVDSAAVADWLSLTQRIGGSSTACLPHVSFPILVHDYECAGGRATLKIDDPSRECEIALSVARRPRSVAN
jgi:hypothetical protein